jgi:RNA polymerase sigma-70 factor (ECF subfamily)
MSQSPGTDPEQLLCRARADSDQALGQLLEQYRWYLELLARVQIGRRLRGKVDPSDLVQETFLEASRHFAHFYGTTEGELASWLRQILAARLSKLVRRYLGTRSRDVRLERELAAELDHSSQMLDRGLLASSTSPSRLAVRREQAVLLAEALGRLPKHYREVLILRHLESLSFPEVACRLGRSLDSVKNLWTRGLARLRDELGGEP